MLIFFLIAASYSLRTAEIAPTLPDQGKSAPLGNNYE
jgi:hypothetical protein